MLKHTKSLPIAKEHMKSKELTPLVFLLVWWLYFSFMHVFLQFYFLYCLNTLLGFFLFLLKSDSVVFLRVLIDYMQLISH